MLLGKKVLGEKKAAEAAAEAALRGANTAVGLGPRVIAGMRVSKAAAVSGNRVAGRRQATPKAPASSHAAKELAFTEAEVVTMLDANPDAWSVILDAEGKRAEGPRAAVARAVLDVAEFTNIPAPILAELRKMAPAADSDGA